MTESVVKGSLLEMEGMIGFCGTVRDGFHVHPDQLHVVYPVGSTVVVENIKTKQQHFLTGHTNNVSCIALSRSGRYIASGQVTHMGFKADVFVWDFAARQQHCKLTLHRVKVEALAFSPGDRYLATLGGGDDGSVVVWNVDTKEAICGSPAQVASAGKSLTVTYSNTDENVFVTGGEGTLRVWRLDVPNRKVWPTEVKLGKMKRTATCVEFSADDSYFYFGTTTGDVFAINVRSNVFQIKGPKDAFHHGVTALRQLNSGEFLVGAGDGSVTIVKGHEAEFRRTKRSAKLLGEVTSIALKGQGQQVYVGTDLGNIYRFSLQGATFSPELVSTCHYSAINDVTFPHGSASLFVTCALENIRVWNAPTNQELLRIHVPSYECNAIEILRDGKAIISGWSDGKIRAFAPESGRDMFTQEEAHPKGVTALASFSDCRHIVSGGGEGSVRVWQIRKGRTPRGAVAFSTALLFTLKEHQNTVTCIKVRRNDAECVTSSYDGSCVVWDLQKQCRVQMMRANTLFTYVCYHPAEHQILTSGTDRKIGYWEAFDGSMIRELDGSQGGSINTMDISGDGRFFVSAGDDRIVKVWDYQAGEITHMGLGHSAPVRRVKISPDEKFIISVSADGAVLRWKFPRIC